MNQFKSIIILAMVVVSGCTPHYTGPEYLTAPRQLAADPVYNRITIARPPEVLPTRRVTFKNAPAVAPIIHLEVNDVSLESATKELGSLAHFRTYTAAAVADRTISLDAVGTIDELADSISTYESGRENNFIFPFYFFSDGS